MRHKKDNPSANDLEGLDDLVEGLGASISGILKVVNGLNMRDMLPEQELRRKIDQPVVAPRTSSGKKTADSMSSARKAGFDDDYIASVAKDGKPELAVSPDIYCDDSGWCLTADLSGAKAECVSAFVKDCKIFLEVDAPYAVYVGSFECPSFVSNENLRISVRNSIVEIFVEGATA